MKSFIRQKISNQIWLFALIVMMINAIVFISAYMTISSSITQNNINYTEQILRQIQDNIYYKMEYLENLLQITGYDKNVVEFLYEENNSKRLELYSTVNRMAIKSCEIEQTIKVYAILGKNGKFYYYGGKTDFYENVLNTLPDNPQNFYSFIDSDDPETRNCFILSTALYNIWNIGADYYIGTISFIVQNDFFGIAEYKDSTNTGLYLLDGDYNIRLANQETTVKEENAAQIIEKLRSNELTGKQEINLNGKFYLVNYEEIVPFDGIVLSITPKQDIINEILWIKTRMLSMLSISLVLVLLVFTFFRHEITAPLVKFSAYMREIKGENVKKLDNRLMLEGFQEIETISVEFNNMMDEINSLTDNLVNTTSVLYETKLQRKQSELNYLKSQINPHFLYNTLEVIIGMAYTEEAPSTAEMIICLSKIFKYSIKGQDRVTVREELNIIRSYIHIQQTRFDDSFRVIYEFEENVMDRIIPKMVLQPVVENAIVHGLEEKSRKGTICIGGQMCTDEDIHLWVWDNGVGMDMPTLQRLQSIINGSSLERSDSVGFENVINRLKLIYGEQARIILTSEIAAGTRIDVYIPSSFKGETPSV